MHDQSSIDLTGKATWVFDLDNTLYPADCDLFSQVEQRIGQFVEKVTGLTLKEARTYQKKLFMDHGTTLNGLMEIYGIDSEEFLRFVHDIDFSPIRRDDRLRSALDRLPGRHLVYTNADADYAGRVLDRLGVADLIDGIYDIKASDFRPKPDPAPYDDFIARFNVDPTSAVMVEDMARNLKPAKALGMDTIWIDTGVVWGKKGHHPDFVDLEIPSLSEWIDDHTKALG